MPWHIVKNKNKFAVVKDSDNSVVAEHDTRAEAVAQLRALYASGKSGARNSLTDMQRLQQIHDNAVDNGASCDDYGKYSESGKSLDLNYAKSVFVDASPDLMAAKFIKDKADTIGGYIALFGNEKLTDIEREFFTKSTDFWLDSFNGCALTWEHGQDGEFKARNVVGHVGEIKADEIGLLYTATLDRAHKYRQLVAECIEAGILGTSSDSAPQYVVREPCGKSVWLKQWPIFAASLTASPAEPRMLDTVGFKSLGIELPGGAANEPDGSKYQELGINVSDMDLRYRILKLYQ